MNDVVKITFPDGLIKEFPPGITSEEIAGSVSSSLKKKAIAGKINGTLIDLARPIYEDVTLEIITPEHEDSLEILRHSSAHLLAQAVKRLFPEVKFGVGPTIENGFYYDMDLEKSLTPEDLPLIEKEMKKIIDANIPIHRVEVTRDEALRRFTEIGDTYKIELINSIPENEQVTIYEQGEFFDLCRGVHVPSTGKIKVVKLLNVAGAYWRGDSNNKMLQRVYGTAFFTKEDLAQYLHILEEADKRDHRKLGKELELFFLSEYGPGFPFFLPKGMVVRNILEELWRKEHEKAGYIEIKTPIMLNKQLWETSGHWFNYRENMYTSEIDEVEFAIKPMSCPGAILVYQNSLHSYRDFPIRMGELGLVHRHEFSGALHGLFRVRNFTQDDAHIFMREDQVEDEIIRVINLIDKFYKEIFGFEYHIELSTKPDNAIGSDEIWEFSEKVLANVLRRKNIEYKINPGDGAFYGPKLDFKIKDAIGRTWQIGTIQLDFNLPERFDINYIGQDGNKHRPVMVHRVIYGSLERFIGILIEHYAGAFPTWLAPVQVKIIPVSSIEHLDYSMNIELELQKLGFRVEVDARDEKVGYKIREAQMKKNPYMLVLGDQEKLNNSINVRKYGEQESEEMSLEKFIERLKSEMI
ncbi:threonine--tRNA ligase [Bacillus pseudomycoides]|uniref:threonine--tRNA ligase n=1 Tax=Bacillus TaxID=1386 RepID=UPI000370D117|nr:MULTISPECIES: threonine--tRNA ligase [Bacillus]MCX2829642.1 threonine--tRNA ligase [Bacillus sp. DHT2]MDR4916757.1 threonine--tRNA ligase [Bacillus pseudomycoides]PEK32365.1 threonine--tRNA ligase [Bacillus pseudomycoides]PEK67977.1 threonine--tRNA ligase [Bacillus pseudomycoides]PEP38627.1 threonine--tRNA ligase [Bacillus pseudomycoides]